MCADARLASLAGELQNSQWNVFGGGIKRQPLKVHTEASFGTVSRVTVIYTLRHKQEECLEKYKYK